MEYVRLGNTGLKVSRLCLGTMTYGTTAWRPWVLDEAASRPFFVRALELGINFFDIYREEEREMLPLCRAEGIGVIPWSPLVRGFLAGNRTPGRKDATSRDAHDTYGHGLYYQDADYDVAERVVEVAAAKGVQPVQVALAWILRQSGVCAPIVGATRLEQLDQLVEGAAVTLTDDEARAVEQ